MKASRVLVTGATGFVGRALCKKLLADGWPVVGTFRTEYSANKLPVRIEKIKIKSIGPNTEWHEALNGIDTVIHLAAQVHVLGNTAADAITEYRRINVAGTNHLAQTAAFMGVRRFIYMSSVKVYGEGNAVAYTEHDSPMPTAPYAISKYEAEQLLQEINDKTDLEVVVLRPPLVYGPHVKANFLQLLKVVDMGIPLPFANVRNRRSLIFLENLLDAIVTCIHHPKAARKTYLLSDGLDTSTPELIQKIASALGRPARLFPFSLNLLRLLAKIIGRSEALGRLLNSFAVDNSRICTELDLIPRFTLAEGLTETAKWYLQTVRI
jgi:nucleoside-diphosphate-sugar epimerase